MSKTLIIVYSFLEGNPIYMSWPHFLHGDPDLLRTVEGLNPDPELHSFILDVDPVSYLYMPYINSMLYEIDQTHFNGFKCDLISNRPIFPIFENFIYEFYQSLMISFYRFII